MTDPIRHEMIAFKTLDEAEQFKLVLDNTFGGFAFTDVVIEAITEPARYVERRYVVVLFNRRLRLPKRVLAFVIAWAHARSYTDCREAIVLVDMESHALYLYC
jgi:hypothetical protein